MFLYEWFDSKLAEFDEGIRITNNSFLIVSAEFTEYIVYLLVQCICIPLMIDDRPILFQDYSSFIDDMTRRLDLSELWISIAEGSVVNKMFLDDLLNNEIKSTHQFEALFALVHVIFFQEQGCISKLMAHTRFTGRRGSGVERVLGF